MPTVRARVASSIKCFELSGAYRHSWLNYLKNERPLRALPSLLCVIFDDIFVSFFQMRPRRR